VKFPLLPSPVVEVDDGSDVTEIKMEGLDLYDNVSVVIWTTTPWTIPGNRAICFSSKINYGLYEVTDAEMEFGPQAGDKLIFADAQKLRDVSGEELGSLTCAHPLRGFNDAYSFDVPLLDGDHVTDDAGTGFVHTAPGHGRDDFEIWVARRNEIEAKGISSEGNYGSNRSE